MEKQALVFSAMDSDETAALRAELEIELKNKKRCSYQSYDCTQMSLDGYNYCAKHILQDKNAPFKQCSYIYSSSSKRCHLPAPRTEKKDYGYCNEHALKATLTRNRQNSKLPPPHTAEVLLHSLSHYVKKSRNYSISSMEDEGMTSEDGSSDKATRCKDPFADLDAVNIYNEKCTDILDFCSESESDIEPSTLSSVWHDAQGDSSGDESIDSENEDVLKHANVYTAEEICLITRDKLVRLQSLYIEQYRHLQHLLKERRRRYLHALKREKETCCNIYNQVRDNPKEQRLYKKLKALSSYHRHHGVDAILSKRVRDQKTKASDGTTTSKAHSYSKCLFTEGGVKCGERTLPLARHCKKHILEDASQVLFKPCGRINGDVECTTPIPAIFDDSTCRLHMEIPTLRCYNQIRKDSESDMDDSLETAQHLPYPPQFGDNIKHEFMNYDIPPEIPKMETLPSMLFEESSQSQMSDLVVPQDVEMKIDDNCTPVGKRGKAEEFKDIKKASSSTGGYEDLSENKVVKHMKEDLNEACNLEVETGESEVQHVKTNAGNKEDFIDVENKKKSPKVVEEGWKSAKVTFESGDL